MKNAIAKLPNPSRKLLAALIGAGAAYAANRLGLNLGTDALNQAVIPGIGLILAYLVPEKKGTTPIVADGASPLAQAVAAEVAAGIDANPAVQQQIASIALKLIASTDVAKEATSVATTLKVDGAQVAAAVAATPPATPAAPPAA